MAYPHPESVIDVLWRPGPRGAPPLVYAILDGAREARIYPAIAALDDYYFEAFVLNAYPESPPS